MCTTRCCCWLTLLILFSSSFANAYVSGMREDLGFEGNQYSIVNTVFTLGYIVGQ